MGVVGISVVSSSLVVVVVMMSMLVSIAYSEDVAFSHTSFPEDPFVDGAKDQLTYRGHAHVQSGTRYLRLTNTDSSRTVPRAWSAGQVLNRWAMEFWNGDGVQRSFETSIVFSITPNKETRGASDGITFFIGSDYSRSLARPIGGAGGNLGIYDADTGEAENTFVIEFDTYPNTQWENNTRHIGINIGKRMSRVSTPFDSGTGENVSATIKYDGITKLTTVTATSGNQTAALSLTYDLRKILTKTVRVGLSSATGQNVALLGIHDVYSWIFNSTLPDSNVVDEILDDVIGY